MGRPNNHVVAVLHDRAAADRAVQALMASGFLQSETYLTAGEAAADALRVNTGQSGLVNWAIKLAERIEVQDDMEVKALYQQAMREGRVLLGVAAPTDERQVAKRRKPHPEARTVKAVRCCRRHRVNMGTAPRGRCGFPEGPRTSQSARSVTVGSTRAARRDGSQLATSATAASSAATPTNVTGSLALTS